MTRKILINGRREEELRVAIVENQTLEDFEIETKRSGLLRNNIYRGVVTNIAPSLNAAFVDFGDSRNGFLAFNDVVESAYIRHGKDLNRISDVLNVGQELIVQVIKDAGGLKGAQVTTNISIAGRYLVLRPKDAKSGVSRKVDDDARADLTQKIRSLDLPEGYGCIVRTNAMDQPRAILLRDAKVLVQLWHKIEAEFAKGKGPQLLYNDQDIVVQAMRDYFDSSINEVLIDDKSCFERAKTYVRATFESGEDKLKLYEDKMPLFTRYGIEKQIEQIYARTVWLPSGGFIVIDPTEALTAIDVNSAHSTKRESQDLTAYHTNLEAAVEIARQLRMRDIGGLIVIDFIDMRQGKHQRDVERVMRNAMARDKARSKVERISANGLLEINRQRLSQALTMRTHLECPTCGGRGFIPSADAIGMTLIREIDARAANGELGGVVIKLHPDIAQQLQNERRREFSQLEIDYNIRIEIVASRDISRGDESIEWLTKRQESELHPERLAASNAEAASIIDVAEAYQANETDDTYRPNDFEEFSSEEARKKRAAKRAARRETRENPGDQKAADVRNEAQDASNTKDTSKKITNAHCATGLAVLSVLIEQMKDRMSDNMPHCEGRTRRMNFRARRRCGKVESNGLQSDIRMFVIDVLKAVCVLSCGCSTDITRKEMLDRMLEVSDHLMNAAQNQPDGALQFANALRNQISSRHAGARIICLFDDAPNAQPDELAKTLLAVRKEAFGNCEDINDANIDKLNRGMAAKCQRIFANDNNVEAEEKHENATGISFDTSAIEAALEGLNELEIQEMFDKAPNFSANTLQNSEEKVEEITEHPFSTRRQRHARNHRRAIGESETISMFAGENAEIITSDVPIAAMTLINDGEKPKANDAQEDISQAITQELPAVPSMRRVRRTRNFREENANTAMNMSVSAPEAAPVQKAAPVQETAKAVEPTTEMLPETSEQSMRRVRRTHRNRSMFGSEEEQVRVEVKPAVVEAAPLVEIAPVVEAPQAEQVISTVSAISERQVETRRVRKTRKIREQNNGNTDAQNVAKVDEQRVPTMNAVQEAPAVEISPVNTAAHPEILEVLSQEEAKPARTERAPRRTRANRERMDMAAREAQPVDVVPKQGSLFEAIADTKAAEPKQEVVESPKAPSEEENRSTRRVRKTRPTKVAASDEVKKEVAQQMTDAQIQNAIIESIHATVQEFEAAAENFQATANPLKAAETPASDTVPDKPKATSERRVRRTRKAAAESSEIASAPVTTTESAPVTEAAPVVSEPEADKAPADRTRTRRTRRTRPEEA